MTRFSLIALLLASALMWPHPAPAQSDPICAPDLFLPAKIKCYLEAAERRNDPSVCLTAAQPVRFQCISLYAEHAKDPKACELLAGPAPQARILRDTCVAGVAVAATAPVLCEEVTTPKLTDSCYAQLVLERGADKSLCERIETEFLKDSCLNN